MLLDPRTLVVVTSVVALTMAFSLLWVFWVDREKGVGLWTLSLVLTTVSTAMIAAGGTHPSPALVATRAALIGLSYGLRYYALCAFFDARRRPVLLWGPAALEGFLVVALAAQPTLAVGLVDLTRVAQTALLIWVVVQHGSVRGSRPQGLMVIGLSIFAAVFLPRAVAGLADPALLGPYFARTPVQSGTWLASFLGTMVSSVALVLMYRERALQQVARQKEALARSEAQLVRVLEGSSDGFGDFSASTGLVSVTPRYCEIYGLPAHTTEISTEALMTFVEPAELPPIQADMAAIVAGEKDGHVWEYRIRRADGTTRWIQSRGRVVGRDASGGPVHVSGAITDITQRKTAEESLRESEARFRALAAFAPVGIFESDPESRNIYVNAETARIYGLSPEEALGRGWEAALHPDDRERSVREWNEAASEDRIFSTETRFLAPDGRVTWARVYGSAIRGRSGEVTGYVGTLLDITKQRAVEHRLAVAARLTAMGTMVAGVAHEINNPMTGIMVGLGTAMGEVRRNLTTLEQGRQPTLEALVEQDAEILEMLEDASEAAARVARIVKDLAIFGSPNQVRTRLRLADIVAEAMRWLPVGIHAEATIRMEDLGAPDVKASRGQLEQVLVNLVTNAVKAARPGTRGTVLVRIGEGSPGTSRLEVIDHGTGIDPAALTKIFDPFFTTRPAGMGRGTGLGLAVCHAIVADHGGTITVESQVGSGSTFRVELPAAPVEA